MMTFALIISCTCFIFLILVSVLAVGDVYIQRVAVGVFGVI